MATTALVPRRQSQRQETSETQTHSHSPKSTENTSNQLLESTDDLLAEIDELVEAEILATEVYTLADAMRDGAQMSPQAIGAWSGVNGETCALQGAHEALKKRGLT